MACIDCILRCADQALACAEPYITTQLRIEVWLWSGNQVGAGSRSVESSLLLPKRFPVKDVSEKLLLASGGVFQRGDVQFGPVIPAYNCNGVTGGHSKAQLDPMSTFTAPERRREVIYTLTGGVDGIFTLVDLRTADPFEWYLTLRNTRRT